ncbi:polyribonucleotide nucleotidyltransferase [Candidatus Epulonipiscium fishelsonii]|uniref:Polyribonucleotide nucleotidyltransferase n=1 Tax=Candidatus Epulonipiscium fishelsonii TaxID=77094 RepID=A0ACC8XFU3_9FIRM|nr:polyribonucleotide nucleotidyltransferase [Epulopiscium sp. SCG-B11WGA-EpuloA1]ONI42862.1 polyribonucleotide nucleotidyltransferase [Epulopiscium sp. SCG-B05WGA-EpuloA1]
MVKTYSTMLAGRELKVEIGKMAELANGAALVSYGETTILATAVASDKPKEGVDFFPLSVNYEEKFYAIGKIPGGFIKREGRPSERAILTSRVIDRPIRPLFPKDYRNDVVITTTVMAVEQDCSPEVTAMIAASLVVDISEIPFKGPVGSVQVGYVDGEIVINPTSAQREKSSLALTVSSSKHKVMMIEAGADEISEEIMYNAIIEGHKVNQEIVSFIESIQADCGKEKDFNYEKAIIPEEVYRAIVDVIGEKRMEVAVFTDHKQTREVQLRALMNEVTEKLIEDGHEDYLIYLEESFYAFEKKTVRRMILKDHQRPDGRKLDQIRPLRAEIDLIPRVHGSGMFTRGQTQVLTVTTLGPLSEIQMLDGLDELESTKRYMHHYNFPPFSVGEARAPRSPGRREIGHGALAERALIPVLPSEEEFPYAIRIVSEVLSSNGSTSQASICGSTLSLMAAGVPIKSPVAGISVGIVTGETDDEFVLLTDIQGLEDFFGDMDFKVGGTLNGITAIQMDMKIEGLTEEIIKGALEQTKIARNYILNEVMSKAISEPRTELSQYAPFITQININPEKISEVIGQKGKVINRIIEETGVKIDIEDDGRVFICAINKAKADRTIEIIEGIVQDLAPGQIFNGKVVRIMNFGAFVELVPGKEGLVHISQLAHERVEKVEDAVQIGDEIKVKVMEIDKQGRVNLSHKALLPRPPRPEKQQTEEQSK